MLQGYFVRYSRSLILHTFFLCNKMDTSGLELGEVSIFKASPPEGLAERSLLLRASAALRGGEMLAK